MKKIEHFDVVIIGAGPAGLMAAIKASELGLNVALLEKNNKPGLKLLMSGGGRCNFSNNSDIKSFARSLGKNGTSFISALNIFGPDDIINFFESRGLKTKIEDNNRVFPESNKASDVLQFLISYARENNVKIFTNSRVTAVVKENNIIKKIILEDSREFFADKFIFACGGKSYPLTGSSGEVFDWLKSLGHNIIELRPALSQLIISDNIKNLEGLSFSDVSIFAKKDKFKSSKIRSAIIFTNKGISGPAALNLSRELNSYDNLDLFLDFFPDKNIDELKIKIKKYLKENSVFSFKNCLSLLIPKRFSLFVLEKLNLDPNKKSVIVSNKEIDLLVNFLKFYKFNFLRVAGFEDAMISSGGVDLSEVDLKTMNSKLIKNLYLVGELLNLDGPTGGYNLQIAWTSGYLAGSSCANL